ncbi:hypothetical protein [Methanogenium cariaci]|jgi:hypothetical protein
MRRFTLSSFSAIGTLQSRPVEVESEGATIDAVRTFTGIRDAAITVPVSGVIDASAYMTADPSYLVPGMRRFGMARFTCPGTLQSRMGAVSGPEATLAAVRDPLSAADRPAAVCAAGGYLAGSAYAVPDVSSGVSVAFEEVYPV